MEIRYNSEFSLERNREEFLYKFNNFKEVNNFRKSLGIIGASNIENLEEMDIFLTDSVKDTFDNIGTYAIVSGGTKGGTSELATTISKRINLPTIGIFPEDGEKYALKNLLDMCIIIPRPMFGDVVWGSETPVLASISDTVVVNGGEWGTMVEIGTIMKRNKTLLKQQKDPTQIILINETKGMTELLNNNKLPLPHSDLICSVDTSSQLTKLLIKNLNSNN